MDHLLLHPHPSVTTAARHFVTDWARRHGLHPDAVDTVELLTSEVVGNAVVHGLGDVLVSVADGHDPHPEDAPVATDPPVVLVCVSDAGRGRPRPRPLTEDATHGRGLALVDLLATAWGVTTSVLPGTCHPSPPLAAAGLGGQASGKTTWFVLDPRGASRAG